MIITGETTSGFKFTIDDRLFSDFRYVRMVSKMTSDVETDDERTRAGFDLAEFTLGKKGLDELIDHLGKDNGGYANTKDVFNEITEINKIAQEQSKDLKN